MNTIQLKWSDDYVLFSEFNEIIEKTESLFNEAKMNLVNSFFPNFETISQRPNKDFFESAQHDLNFEFKGNSNAFTLLIDDETMAGSTSCYFYEKSNELVIKEAGDDNFSRYSIEKISFESIVNNINSTFKRILKWIKEIFEPRREQQINSEPIKSGIIENQLKNPKYGILIGGMKAAAFIAKLPRIISDGIKSGLQFGNEKLKKVSEKIKDGFHKIVTVGKEKGKPIVSGLNEIGQKIKTGGKKVGEKIIDGGKNVVKAVGNFLRKIL